MSRADSLRTGDRFVWPPREPAESAIPPATPHPAPPEASAPTRLDALVRALRDAERTWLAPIAPPLNERIQLAGWSPDPFSAFCARCGASVGRYEVDEFGCSSCRSADWPWDRFVRLGLYEPPLSQWIAEVKFTRWRALGRSLGRLLGDRLRMAGAARLEPERWIVVGVPPTWRRRMGRGIDHARALSEGVAQELDLPLARPLTSRHRPSQRSVPAGARLPNAAGRFSLRRGVSLGGRTVILIDDVCTSGGTVAAAARALLGRSRRPGERTAGRGADGVWVGALAVASDQRDSIDPTPAERDAL